MVYKKFKFNFNNIKENYTKNISLLNNKKIAVIGDVILDEYIKGQAERISPEAPIPVIKVNSKYYSLGGAANVARNLSRLGVNVFLYGLLGNDTSGKIIKNSLKEEKINDNLLKSNKIKTIIKTRVVSDGQQIVRYDQESYFNKIDSLKLLGFLLKNINKFNLIIISDYGKGTVTNVSEISKICRKNSIPLFIDPKGASFQKYAGADLISPNLKEFEKIVGYCSSDKELIQRAFNLMKKFNIKNLLITKGKRGMTFLNNNREYFHIGAENVEVANVVGAGDTVISWIGALSLTEYNLESSIYLANLAAGEVVKLEGTSTLSTDQIYNKLESKNKILDINDLKKNLDFLKKNNKTIVFTNGCFDLIHKGHLEYLKKSKKLGDILIVGLNSDKSVIKLKGQSRPFNSFVDRANILSEFISVDFIVLFNELTPLNLIKLIKPDIITKGGDYAKHEVVGFSFLKKYGGEVKIIKFLKGYSSTKMIKKINNT